VTTGSAGPEALRHSHLRLPGTTNVRDLAGYPAAQGRMIAPHRLLRGEVLAEPGSREGQGVWDEAHRAAFDALGLRTIVDLRSAHERTATPSAWARATGADVVELPIAEGGEGADTNYVRKLLAGQIAVFTEADMTQFYRDTLDRRAETFAAAVAVLAGRHRLPALVHCSAGKDRTGLLIALVLELVGTPRQTVIDDYALTGVLRPNRIEAYADRFIAAGVDPDAARLLFETPAASMSGALAHIDEAYGGVERYLTNAGSLDPGVIVELRVALLTPSPTKTQR
jgi:protein-tyrosine phosphatase